MLEDNAEYVSELQQEIKEWKREVETLQACNASLADRIAQFEGDPVEVCCRKLRDALEAELLAHQNWISAQFAAERIRFEIEADVRQQEFKAQWRQEEAIKSALAASGAYNEALQVVCEYDVGCKRAKIDVEVARARVKLMAVPR